MPYVVDPYSGLRLYELSHVWNSEAPSYPGQADVIMRRGVKHAEHGVLAWRISTSLHTGTHMNAPLHMVQRGADLASIPVERLFGNGVVLDIPKGSFETITAEDLENAQPVKEGDIVVINTGWHHKYSDSLEYYGEAPGLTECAAQWLIDKKVKIVAVDTPFVDCPLATSMGPHRGGPQMKRLAKTYVERTGKDPNAEHGKWYIAHKLLAAAGIPTIEQVGGDVDELSGKRATFAALPWKFAHGDACQIRFVAMTDPEGKVRIDSGKEA
ncbi:MAG TPA: cyclase family protein [Clostridiales bacterium]|jgi:kynurenine formamidase|nr:cyclase family protein [Clostridiales bacterium]